MAASNNFREAMQNYFKNLNFKRPKYETVSWAEATVNLEYPVVRIDICFTFIKKLIYFERGYPDIFYPNFLIHVALVGMATVL